MFCNFKIFKYLMVKNKKSELNHNLFQFKFYNKLKSNETKNTFNFYI